MSRKTLKAIPKETVALGDPGLSKMHRFDQLRYALGANLERLSLGVIVLEDHTHNLVALSRRVLLEAAPLVVMRAILLPVPTPPGSTSLAAQASLAGVGPLLARVLPRPEQQALAKLALRLTIK